MRLFHLDTLCLTTYIWFPHKIPYIAGYQYNTPWPKVHTHTISYSLPNGRDNRQIGAASERRGLYLSALIVLLYHPCSYYYRLKETIIQPSYGIESCLLHELSQTGGAYRVIL